MDRNLVTVIFCLLIAGSIDTYAQRHYQNISALELNYGSNVFGDYAHYGNLSFSKYVNRKSYWKAGISYLEKPYDYAIPQQSDPATIPATSSAPATTRNAPAAPETPAPAETEWAEKKAWDLHLDGGYYYTIVTNLKSIYWNVGLGAFIGCEFDKRPDEKYTFIVGPKLETELEVFVAPRIALLGRVQQCWNPLSVEDWNTVWNVGIKFLLY